MTEENQDADPSESAPHQDDIDSKLGFYTFEQIKKIADKAQPYLIDRLIIPGSLGVLVGEWGIGKSPFAIQLAITLAAAIKKFLDQYATTGRPLRVLYVDMENGATAILDVAAQVCQFLQLPEVPNTFKVYSPNFSDRPAQYAAWGVRNYILNVVMQSPFDFIIIDPLRAFCPQAESSNEEAMNFLTELRGLAKASAATILMIHHPRKPKEESDFCLERDPHNWLTQACGSAAIIQNVDYRMGFQASRGGVIFRSYLRVQGWGPALHLVREYDDDEQPMGYRLEGGIDKLDGAMRLRFDELPKEFTTAQLKEIFQKTSKPANDVLKQLVSLGLIKKVERGKWEKLVDVRPAAAGPDDVDVPVEEALGKKRK